MVQMISGSDDSNASSSDGLHHHSNVLLQTPTVDQQSHAENEIIDSKTSDSSNRMIETPNNDEDNTNDDICNGIDDGSDYDDFDDDVIDIHDFLHSLNNNHRKKLHSSTHLSVYDGCLEIIKVSRELNLNKFQVNRLLRGIRSLLPIENKLPRTTSGLFKVVLKYRLVGLIDRQPMNYIFSSCVLKI